MFHKDTLRHLMPLDLGPHSQADLELEAKQLDDAQASIDQFLLEIFPDRSTLLLPSWEKAYGLTAAPGDSIGDRQLKVCLKMREMGRLDKSYFITLAEALGITLVIQELNPFMAGWSWPGLETLPEEARFIWRAIITDLQGAFRAGAGAAGEGLGAGGPQYLQPIFDELKPAHTFVEITLQ